MITRVRHALTLLLAVALLIFAVACTDDPDREPDVPAGTGDGTPVADFLTPTPNGEEQDEDAAPGPDVTIVPEATVPPADADDGTPSTSDLPAPEGTGTPAPVAERTVTPDAEAVGPQGELLWPDLSVEAPDLENYTMTITGEIRMADAAGRTDSPIELTYQRSAQDTFYMLYEGDDDFTVETWRIGEQFWIREDDEVNEVGEEMADAFDVNAYLTMLPQIGEVSEAEMVGEEDIAGRTATHYEIPAEEAISVMTGARDAGVHDADGRVEVWIDEEENVILRMVVDLQWSDDADNDNLVDLEYTISDIGETEDVQPPDA